MDCRKHNNLQGTNIFWFLIYKFFYLYNNMLYFKFFKGAKYTNLTPKICMLIKIENIKI